MIASARPDVRLIIVRIPYRRERARRGCGQGCNYTFRTLYDQSCAVRISSDQSVSGNTGTVQH